MLATIRMTEDGLRGFGLGHSPYSPALRNDPYFSGTNLSCCIAAFSNAALCTYGPGTYKLDRDVELAEKDDKRAQGTYIVYSPEHRAMRELPLQTLPEVREPNRALYANCVLNHNLYPIRGATDVSPKKPSQDRLHSHPAIQAVLPHFLVAAKRGCPREWPAALQHYRRQSYGFFVQSHPG